MIKMLTRIRAWFKLRQTDSNLFGWIKMSKYFNSFKSNRGFTLVELLVTMVILGIITGMAIPLIRNISEAQKEKKYKTYMNSVKSSAKLYVDSYSEDLFGNNKSGCAYISYEDMADKSLIKNFQEENVSCYSDKTYVRVVKLNGKYSYAVQLGCGSSSDKKNKIKDENVDTIYPSGGVGKSSSCSSFVDTKFELSASPEKYEKVNKQKLGIKLSMTSFTGINNGYKVYYAWKKVDSSSTDDVLWKEVYFKYISKTKQEETILNGNEVTLTSNYIYTPEKETGKYNLLVKVSDMMDITGNSLMKEKTGEYTFGPYIIDNTAPVINSLSVTSANGSFNSLNAHVNINATDNEMMSPQSELMVCIKTDKNSSCSSSDYLKYNSIYDKKFSGKYDGSKKIAYVYVKDKAGNVTNGKTTYTLYKECSDVVKDTNNIIKEKSSCTKTCGGGTKINIVGTKDAHTSINCSSARTMENTVECNLKPCKPTINNPTGGNWVNYSFSLTVSSFSNNLGYWYYSYDKNSWIRYDAPNYNSYGKSTFTTSPFSAERNQKAYIKVCNNKASGPKDDANCSDYASTYIRIDKTPPPSPKIDNFQTYRDSFWVNYDNCSGSGGTYSNVNCTVGVTSKIGYFYYAVDISIVDNPNGSGIKDKQVIWDHNGTARTCPQWTDNCDPWRLVLNRGDGVRGRWLKACDRGIDNAGNVGYYSCEIIYIQ